MEHNFCHVHGSHNSVFIPEHKDKWKAELEDFLIRRCRGEVEDYWDSFGVTFSSSTAHPSGDTDTLSLARLCPPKGWHLQSLKHEQINASDLENRLHVLTGSIYLFYSRAV